MGSFQRLLGNDDIALNLILPLGISFYSFSAIGYLVDLGRNKVEPRDLKDVALYLAFFPKITSGSIQRSGDFFRQMDQRRRIGWATFSIGIQIFMFGLFKKIVLADRLSVFVDQVYDAPGAFGSLTVFLAAIAYSLQIYFDFSGYSDMAIGVSKIIGVDLPSNFNLPYLAHNVTEFWKRWHITLSSWLQEYLYIPLGGNRKGKARAYVNLVITMVLGGIWHGANWTYIVWGLLHGVALAVHKVFMRVTKSAERPHLVLTDVISIFVTFLFTTFGWVFFRADSVVHAFEILKRMFGFHSGLEQPYVWLFVAVAVFVASSLAAAIKSKRCAGHGTKQNVSYIHGFYPILDLAKFWHLVLFFVFCGLILCLAYTGGSPFIYGNY
ncbi:MBOAT family O-acyltransferase [Lachnospiraceae bacterium 29-84]